MCFFRKLQHITDILNDTVLLYFYLDVSPPLDISSDTSNPVQAGVPVTFTCTLDANPLPRYSIWTSDGQSQEWVDVDSNNDHITLPLHKRHNKIDIFCRAEGNISGYPVDSGSKSFTVECKCGNALILELIHQDILVAFDSVNTSLLRN